MSFRNYLCKFEFIFLPKKRKRYVLLECRKTKGFPEVRKSLRCVSAALQLRHVLVNPSSFVDLIIN